MNDATLYALVRSVDPLRNAAHHESSPALLDRIMRERRPRATRRRLAIAAVVFAVAAVAVGLAVGATRWLGGPAPPSVVTDFQAYTPQLGFHPHPHDAILVAGDGDVTLYETANDEGTYCLVLDEPWKPALARDGGTCVPSDIASEPFVAGVLGTSGDGTYVVGGRTTDAGARTVRFTLPDGETVERPIGANGFFVAKVHAARILCANGDWRTTFTIADGDGRELGSTPITLVQARGSGVCLFSFLHA